MPVVQKIVSIDVQSNLSKFTEEFDKYNDLLSKQPEIWAEVSKENKVMGEGFKVMGALMLAQAELARKAAVEHKKIASESSAAAFSWESMGRSSKSVFNNIVGATRQLEKWTGIFTLASGLAVGGSLFGFDRFAASAGAGRREATGLGLSYGAKRAFGVTYGRFVDSDTLLSGVSTARGDPGSAEARAMYSLGMIPGQSGDTAEASQETLKRVRALAQRTPDSMLGTVTKAYGLDALGYSTELMRRLKGASDKDLQEGEYKKRIQDFGVTEKALKDMQEFDMALESAGIKIKSTFIELLGPLAPELKLLAEGMSDALKSILGSQGFKDGIAWAAKGLHEFGEYVNKPEFKQDIKDLADGIGYAAKRLVEAGRWLGLLPGDKEAEEKKKQAQAEYDKMPWWAKPGYLLGGGMVAEAMGGSKGAKVKTLPDGTLIVDSPVPGMSAKYDNDMLGIVAQLEASPDINGRPQTSPAGAVGKYQIMKDTAIGLGFTDQDRYDPDKNKQMAQKLLDELSARYHGDKAQVLAAYNGGPTAGDYLRDHGNRELPRGYGETQQYLHRAGIEVTINNNTGGSAVTSVASGGGVSGVGTSGPSILQ